MIDDPAEADCIMRSKRVRQGRKVQEDALNNQEPFVDVPVVEPVNLEAGIQLEIGNPEDISKDENKVNEHLIKVKETVVWCRDIFMFEI